MTNAAHYRLAQALGEDHADPSYGKGDDMTTQALTTTNGTAVATGWDRQQIDLLKQTVAAGTSDLEFALFAEVCKTTGLNPFQKQIYAIMRNAKDDRGNWSKRMTIQTGIDGYRLIAARSGVHAGTSDAEYGQTDKNGYPEWARVTVSKLLLNGHVATFTATARWSEYVQTDKNGNPSGQWPKMPYLMLAKCAEALALRKAFPAELSGVYTSEEMTQADTPHVITVEPSLAEVEASMGGQDNQPPKAANTQAKADEWGRTSAAFWATVREAATGQGIDPADVDAVVHHVLKEAYKVTSIKDLTPPKLKAFGARLAQPGVFASKWSEWKEATSDPIPDSFEVEATEVEVA